MFWLLPKMRQRNEPECAELSPGDSEIHWPEIALEPKGTGCLLEERAAINDAGQSAGLKTSHQN